MEPEKMPDEEDRAERYEEDNDWGNVEGCPERSFHQKASGTEGDPQQRSSPNDAILIDAIEDEDERNNEKDGAGEKENDLTHLKTFAFASATHSGIALITAPVKDIPNNPQRKAIPPSSFGDISR